LSAGGHPAAPPLGWLRTAIALRVASAATIAAVAGLCLYLGRPYFHLLVALFALVMIGEWARVACGPAVPVATVGLAMALLVAVAIAATVGWLWWAAAAAIAGAAAVWGLGAATRARQADWLALGLLYVGAPVIAIVGLFDGPGPGAWNVFWVIAAVAATDIGAFFVGRAVGGPRLAPRLSPAKTWAGLIGGTVASILAGATIGAYYSDQPVLFWAVGGALVALISQAGDLVESAFKRHFKVKDASGLIPGHGGVLDRVDGLVAAVVVVALYVWANEGLVVPWT
jgi:phosphatidate cytidylyltransferase